MGRLLVLVSAIVLVETMFYAAITPLLPYYEEQFGLTKASVGALAAAYPAGVLLGALPAGWLTARAGVKPAVLGGLALLAVASVAFAFGQTPEVLDAARFVQGLGGAAMWSGGLGWLVAGAPRQRKGEILGTAFAFALGGALLGPVLGVIAVAIGPEPVFTSVAVLAAALALWAWRTPAAPSAVTSLREGIPAAARDNRVLVGLWCIGIVGLFFGCVEVLVPLRLDDLGASAAVIGATFVAAAGIEALVSPLYGRLADRRGRWPGIRFGLLAGALVSVAVVLPGQVWPLVAVVVIGAPLVGGLWTPALALLSDGADAVGLDQGFAFALMNFALAAAQVLGAGLGGASAEVAGDALPYGVLAATCALSLAFAARPRGAVAR